MADLTCTCLWLLLLQRAYTRTSSSHNLLLIWVCIYTEPSSFNTGTLARLLYKYPVSGSVKLSRILLGRTVFQYRHSSARVCPFKDNNHVNSNFANRLFTYYIVCGSISFWKLRPDNNLIVWLVSFGSWLITICIQLSLMSSSTV